MQLVIDGLQMITSLLFCSFVYCAMLRENAQFKKLRMLYRFYTGFVFFYIALIFIFPDFIRTSFLFFGVSRGLIFIISLFFYIEIAKNLKVVYFRYLFAAITFLFITGILAFWDSTVNEGISKYTGFQYLCFGYFLENICFVTAFIYKYFESDQEKNEAAQSYKLQLIKTQIEIQNQTMQHIGREIHDNIGQKLTLASLYTQQLAFENKAPHIKDRIETVSVIINESLQELRQLSQTLNDDSMDSLKIHDLIKAECSKINALKKCIVHFTSNFEDLDFSYEVKVGFYRIIQEFIQNSVKYAKCQNIFIDLNQDHDKVKLRLHDDGIGFKLPAKNFSGIGLKNMKQRASDINATFNLITNNEGTTVTIIIPFTNEK